MFNKHLIENVGISLKGDHYQDILDSKPNVPWFEILSENFMFGNESNLEYLLSIRKNYPLTLHGVGMSIGSADGVSLPYLQELKKLIETVSPSWVSDHLSWSNYSNKFTNDLLPLPFTNETIDVVSDNIKFVQDYLGIELVLENPSSYLRYCVDEMTEWEFINKIVEKSGCKILLDINNIYVNSYNHNFDAKEFINNLPKNIVKEFHLSGHLNKEAYLFDDHGDKVCDEVWDLYRYALNHFGNIPTLIEWDNNVPTLSTLEEEAKKAQRLFS
ncbi:DUF692 domain-containing protein [Arcobacteraceae bacterium]|nr:DUF692 domain-containing protein [Arcobacteraceae bacterium]